MKPRRKKTFIDARDLARALPPHALEHAAPLAAHLLGPYTPPPPPPAHPPPVPARALATPLDCFWVCTLLMWTGFAALRLRFLPSLQLHMYAMEQLEVLRQRFFALQRAQGCPDARRTALAAVGVVARSLVYFQRRCRIPDERLRGAARTREFLRRDDVRREVERVTPQHGEQGPGQTYFRAALEALWGVVRECVQQRWEERVE